MSLEKSTLMLEQGLDLMLGWAHVVDLAPAIVVQIREVAIFVRHLLTQVARQLTDLSAVTKHEVDCALACSLEVL